MLALFAAIAEADWWITYQQSQERIALEAGPGWNHPESGLLTSGYRVTDLAFPRAAGPADALDTVIAAFWEQVWDYVDARNKLAQEAASI